ncbi:hypothetical protein AX16_003822 [Volvariella volvacea WC 439]|nr:hypothetical protein AX16_003822 [Volvariella volvacea WC 439]
MPLRTIAFTYSQLIYYILALGLYAIDPTYFDRTTIESVKQFCIYGMNLFAGQDHTTRVDFFEDCLRVQFITPDCPDDAPRSRFDEHQDDNNAQGPSGDFNDGNGFGNGNGLGGNSGNGYCDASTYGYNQGYNYSSGYRYNSSTSYAGNAHVPGGPFANPFSGNLNTPFDNSNNRNTYNTSGNPFRPTCFNPDFDLNTGSSYDANTGHGFGGNFGNTAQYGNYGNVYENASGSGNAYRNASNFYSYVNASANAYGNASKSTYGNTWGPSHEHGRTQAQAQGFGQGGHNADYFYGDSQQPTAQTSEPPFVFNPFDLPDSNSEPDVCTWPPKIPSSKTQAPSNKQTFPQPSASCPARQEEEEEPLRLAPGFNFWSTLDLNDENEQEEQVEVNRDSNWSYTHEYNEDELMDVDAYVPVVTTMDVGVGVEVGTDQCQWENNAMDVDGEESSDKGYSHSHEEVEEREEAYDELMEVDRARDSDDESLVHFRDSEVEYLNNLSCLNTENLSNSASCKDRVGATGDRELDVSAWEYLVDDEDEDRDRDGSEYDYQGGYESKHNFDSDKGDDLKDERAEDADDECDWNNSGYTSDDESSSGEEDENDDAQGRAIVFVGSTNLDGAQDEGLIYQGCVIIASWRDETDPIEEEENAQGDILEDSASECRKNGENIGDGETASVIMNNTEDFGELVIGTGQETSKGEKVIQAAQDDGHKAHSGENKSFSARNAETEKLGSIEEEDCTGYSNPVIPSGINSDSTHRSNVVQVSPLPPSSLCTLADITSPSTSPLASTPTSASASPLLSTSPSFSSSTTSPMSTDTTLLALMLRGLSYAVFNLPYMTWMIIVFAWFVMACVVIALCVVLDIVGILVEVLWGDEEANGDEESRMIVQGGDQGHEHEQEQEVKQDEDDEDVKNAFYIPGQDIPALDEGDASAMNLAGSDDPQTPGNDVEFAQTDLLFKAISTCLINNVSRIAAWSASTLEAVIDGGLQLSHSVRTCTIDIINTLLFATRTLTFCTIDVVFKRPFIALFECLKLLVACAKLIIIVIERGVMFALRLAIVGINTCVTRPGVYLVTCTIKLALELRRVLQWGTKKAMEVVKDAVKTGYNFVCAVVVSLRTALIWGVERVRRGIATAKESAKQIVKDWVLSHASAEDPSQVKQEEKRDWNYDFGCSDEYQTMLDVLNGEYKGSPKLDFKDDAEKLFEGETTVYFAMTERGGSVETDSVEPARVNEGTPSIISRFGMFGSWFARRMVREEGRSQEQDQVDEQEGDRQEDRTADITLVEDLEIMLALSVKKDDDSKDELEDEGDLADTQPQVDIPEEQISAQDQEREHEHSLEDPHQLSEQTIEMDLGLASEDLVSETNDRSALDLGLGQEENASRMEERIVLDTTLRLEDLELTVDENERSVLDSGHGSEGVANNDEDQDIEWIELSGRSAFELGFKNEETCPRANEGMASFWGFENIDTASPKSEGVASFLSIEDQLSAVGEDISFDIGNASSNFAPLTFEDLCSSTNASRDYGVDVDTSTSINLEIKTTGDGDGDTDGQESAKKTKKSKNKNKKKKKTKGDKGKKTEQAPDEAQANSFSGDNSMKKSRDNPFLSTSKSKKANPTESVDAHIFATLSTRTASTSTLVASYGETSKGSSALVPENGKNLFRGKHGMNPLMILNDSTARIDGPSSSDEDDVGISLYVKVKPKRKIIKANIEASPKTWTVQTFPEPIALASVTPIEAPYKDLAAKAYENKQLNAIESKLRLFDRRKWGYRDSIHKHGSPSVGDMEDQDIRRLELPEDIIDDSEGERSSTDSISTLDDGISGDVYESGLCDLFTCMGVEEMVRRKNGRRVTFAIPEDESSDPETEGNSMGRSGLSPVTPCPPRDNSQKVLQRLQSRNSRKDSEFVTSTPLAARQQSRRNYSTPKKTRNTESTTPTTTPPSYTRTSSRKDRICQNTKPTGSTTPTTTPPPHLWKARSSKTPILDDETDDEICKAASTPSKSSNKKSSSSPRLRNSCEYTDSETEYSQPPRCSTPIRDSFAPSPPRTPLGSPTPSGRNNIKEIGLEDTFDVKAGQPSTQETKVGPNALAIIPSQDTSPANRKSHPVESSQDTPMDVVICQQPAPAQAPASALSAFCTAPDRAHRPCTQLMPSCAYHMGMPPPPPQYTPQYSAFAQPPVQSSFFPSSFTSSSASTLPASNQWNRYRDSDMDMDCTSVRAEMDVDYYESDAEMLDYTENKWGPATPFFMHQPSIPAHPQSSAFVNAQPVPSVPSFLAPPVLSQQPSSPAPPIGSTSVGCPRGTKHPGSAIGVDVYRNSNTQLCIPRVRGTKKSTNAGLIPEQLLQSKNEVPAENSNGCEARGCMIFGISPPPLFADTKAKKRVQRKSIKSEFRERKNGRQSLGKSFRKLVDPHGVVSRHMCIYAHGIIPKLILKRRAQLKGVEAFSAGLGLNSNGRTLDLGLGAPPSVPVATSFNTMEVPRGLGVSSSFSAPVLQGMFRQGQAQMDVTMMAQQVVSRRSSTPGAIHGISLFGYSSESSPGSSESGSPGPGWRDVAQNWLDELGKEALFALGAGLMDYDSP